MLARVALLSIGLVCLASQSVAAQEADTTDPEVGAVRVTPGSVPTAGPHTIEVEIDVSDDSSGVSRVQVVFAEPDGGIWRLLTVRQLLSGTPTSGVLQTEIVTEVWERPGERRLSGLVVWDAAGNVRAYSAAELADTARFQSVTFIGPEDLAPPEVHSISINPGTVYNATENLVALDFTFSDDASGLWYVYYEIVHPHSYTWFYGHIWLPEALVEGTPQAGTARALITVPAWTPPGVWEIVTISAQDRVHHLIDDSDVLASGVSVPALEVTGVFVDGSGRPTAPTALEVSATSVGEVTASWDSPVYVGVPEYTDYLLEIRVAGMDEAEGSASGASPDVVGGASVGIDQFPWQGALLYSDEPDPRVGQFCGASLVAPRLAVTAAHCVLGKSPGDIFVSFGKARLSQVTVDDRVPVTEIVVNPGYNSESLVGDIAVLRLAAPARGAQLLNIWTDKDGPTDEARGQVSGWGVFWWDDDYYYLPDQLQAAELRVQAPNRYTCGRWGDLFSTFSHICGYVPLERVGPCYGDSGGPLAMLSESRWWLIGVTSFGPGPELGDCGEFHFPSIFTRVSKHAEWLNSFGDSLDWTPIAVGRNQSVTLSGLEPGARYEIRVAARNEHGASDYTVTEAAAGGSAEYFPWPRRLAGGDRYRTAAAVTSVTYLGPEPVVFVASGQGFADALAGAAVAGRMGAPLLLVSPTSLPPSTAAELQRLDPDTIVILGGLAAVSAAVEDALNDFAPVVRLAGGSRYETAVAISQFGFPDGAPQVFIAAGTGFADALAGAPAAAHLGGPVLLTKPDALPEAVLAEIRRLAPQRIVVLGGTATVSVTVLDELAALAPEVVRLSGPNRYQTAIVISQYAFDDSPVAYVATGLNYPDALAGAAAAGAGDAPLFLVPGVTIPFGLVTAMRSLGIQEVVILGGQAAVGDLVQLQLGVEFGPG